MYKPLIIRSINLLKFFPFLFVLLSSVLFCEVEQLRIDVVSVRPHDKHAFTQGLIFNDTHFYESTGCYGRSSIRLVDPSTGQVVREKKLAPHLFGEGLALVDDKLIQLTWKEKKALLYDAQTLESKGELSYEGEGWGLCYDGQTLFMSDGSPKISIRDPKTFAKTGELNVTLDGQPVFYLNALAYVEGALYANVWSQDRILRIDKQTGEVTAVIDAEGLLPQKEKKATRRGDVLNGIAYDPYKKVFFVTGKNWPLLFEVRFISD